LAKIKLWATRTLHGKVQREEGDAKHALTSSMILVVKFNWSTSISSHLSLHLSKRKGVWWGGAESRENNGYGVNE
jgi:hypothetical protein